MDLIEVELVFPKGTALDEAGFDIEDGAAVFPRGNDPITLLADALTSVPLVLPLPLGTDDDFDADEDTEDEDDDDDDDDFGVAV